MIYGHQCLSETDNNNNSKNKSLHVIIVAQLITLIIFYTRLFLSLVLLIR